MSATSLTLQGLQKVDKIGGWEELPQTQKAGILLHYNLSVLFAFGMQLKFNQDS